MEKEYSKWYLLKKSIETVLDYLNMRNKDIDDEEEGINTNDISLQEYFARLEYSVLKLETPDREPSPPKVTTCEICWCRVYYMRSIKKYCEWCLKNIKYNRSKNQAETKKRIRNK